LVIEDESRDRRAREADFLEADGSASASPETERRLLIDALWGENPPPSAPKLPQIYVSQLRKTLPPAARVQTREAGYALELERGSSVDATRLRKSAERWPRGAACGPSAAVPPWQLPREASPAKVAKDGQYNNDNDDDPKPGRHGDPFVRHADSTTSRPALAT